MPRDPVCGMNVREGKDSIRSEYKGQTYYFCSDRCRSEFDRNPGSYAGDAANEDRNRADNSRNQRLDNRQPR
ncbi:MAG TPA: YHS domain-containing protein [Firmicutes bacterium]|nr:YHS domain-containing protein [Candidatus Fermentithermobacillaceae bacterium]